ncbi:MAG: hypothetical protein EB089_06035, partial [Acidimicrobiia bacterium]|nr:hypothetical protein [Acidimicrobiia bacterium]
MTMRIKKSLLATALGFSLVAGLAQVPTAGAVVEWALTEDAVSLGLTGVSPHVERTGNADRLWYPGGLAGTAVADCNTLVRARASQSRVDWAPTSRRLHCPTAHVAHILS